MADSVDRVFVHALNTVKRIPRSGSARPPTSDRLRLYGLYKQAMEGDVDGVMERPTASSGSGLKGEELEREREKWDAWNSQKGLTRTESKRRYIEALIETMHKYATVGDGQDLVTELEFVWNQIKSNTPTSSSSSPNPPLVSSKYSHASPKRAGRRTSSSSSQSPAAEGKQGNSSSRRFQQPLSGMEGPMKILNPMSEQDEAEMRSIAQLKGDSDDSENEDYDDDEDGQTVDTRRSRGTSRQGRGGVGSGSGATGGTGSLWWSKTVERALVSLSAEVAALREQITSGREWRLKKDKALGVWVRWISWTVIKHLLIDLGVLAIVLIWMRKRRDRRLEILVKEIFRLGREYLRKILPS